MTETTRMNQDAIWEHFQNEDVHQFNGARPRLEFLVRALRTGERALNIGVGSGALEELALRNGVEVWSLDPSERAIRQLRDRLKLGNRALAGYSQKMPFESESFDVVIMSEVIEHLDPEIRLATLGEVFRVLRKGGRFIGTVPAREALDLSRVVCPHCANQFHRWGHQATFDVQAVTKMLKSRFDVQTVQERYFNEWASVGWGKRAAGLIKKFLSWKGLGPYAVLRNIYFCAIKP